MEQWTITRKASDSRGGMVVSQHYLASEVGADVLRAGGNAVDAAIATSLAIGVVEPWMSGLGGGGSMLVAKATAPVEALFFGMKSPRRLNLEDYPLSGGVGGDLFSWPAVKNDHNVHGPLSVAVPGLLAGLGESHRRYGTMPWSELVCPALNLMKQGVTVDWHTTLKIAAAAPQLAAYPDSANIYLPDGYTPAGQWGGPSPKLFNPKLVNTLQQVAVDGASGGYQGELLETILKDADSLDIPLTRRDFEDYQVGCMTPLSYRYRDVEVFAVPGQTAGPSLLKVLDDLSKTNFHATYPDQHYYGQLAESLRRVYAERLHEESETLSRKAPACTTHISVADKWGNAVSLTQTLLSVFGSKVTLPETGLLMNNGIMWFDPVPGKPNSLAPAAFPLTNMCPAIFKRQDGETVALGASGGRRILPAVAQFISFLTDFGMSMVDAVHHPRIDVSNTSGLTLDQRLDNSVVEHLQQSFQVEPAQAMVYPNLFGCPNCASVKPGQGSEGLPFVFSPVSAAIGE